MRVADRLEASWSLLTYVCIDWNVRMQNRRCGVSAVVLLFFIGHVRPKIETMDDVQND